MTRVHSPTPKQPPANSHKEVQLNGAMQGGADGLYRASLFSGCPSPFWEALRTWLLFRSTQPADVDVQRIKFIAQTADETSWVDLLDRRGHL